MDVTERHVAAGDDLLRGGPAVRGPRLLAELRAAAPTLHDGVFEPAFDAA